MTLSLTKLWQDITAPAHWSAFCSYLKSGDMRGLAMQLHALYLRHHHYKQVLQIDTHAMGPSPEHWPDERPLISVIIPCFNYGQYVQEAIDSVLAQDFQDFEIILIDGGSTDGTDQIIRAIDHPKIRTFLREGLHLLGDNRNFGIAQARGKYVFTLDADDKITPDCLLKLVFLLEATNLDVAGSAKQFFGDSHHYYHGVTQPSLRDLQIGNPVSIGSLYPKSMWEQNGPFQDFGTGDTYIFEDWEFWYRAAMHGARFYMATGELLFLHRIHSYNMSRDAAIKPRKVHADFIKAHHATATDKHVIARSEKQQQTVQLRQNPLVNLTRQNRPCFYSTIQVTDKPPVNTDMHSLLLSLSRDDKTSPYCLPRFLPAILYVEFIRFVQHYFGTDSVKTVTLTP